MLQETRYMRSNLNWKIKSPFCKTKCKCCIHLFSMLVKQYILFCGNVFCLCSQGHVVMGTQAVSPYQQVIEKTKNLAFRSQVLAMNIEKKINAKNTEVSLYSMIAFKLVKYKT